MRPGEGAPVAPGGKRLDIQGLRAVAVLLVLLFHAQVPIPGGFVGVDVFFVISGFVITAMLQRELSLRGRVRFGTFYWRRFKRLTPALAVVVSITMILTVLFLSPFGTQQNAGATGLGAMLLVANLVISRTTGEYFDAPAETNPLLNTWSLSVEEQFYLAFPAILAIGWVLARRLGRGRGVPVLIVSAVAAASFTLAVLGSSGKADIPFLGFYSPLTRAWEFAVGALVALLASNVERLPARAAPALGAIGVGLLAISLFVLDGATPFPGVWTLLPVTATLLLLVAGVHQENPVSRALATRPMVKIGDWSYSLYLWHWPLIVLAVYLWPQTPGIALLACAVSVLPALASYRWVEQPIRSLRPLPRPTMAALVAAVVLPPVVLALSVSLVANRFWLPRYESGVVPVAHSGDIGHVDYHGYVDRTFYPCSPESIRAAAPTWQGVVRCHQSQPAGDVKVAIVGDSHAEHLFLGFAEALPQTNVAYFIQGEQPVRSASPQMADIIDHVAATPSISTVIVSSYWFKRGVPEDLSATLAAFTAAGKAVFVTDDVPSFPFDPVQCKYQKSPLVPVTECDEPLEEYRVRYEQFAPSLVAAVAAVDGATLVPTGQYFCGPDSCAMNAGDLLLYRDPDHLNMNGTRYLAERMLRDNPDLATAVTGN